ncbi:HNH endonuclease [Bacillus toyonensis]
MKGLTWHHHQVPGKMQLVLTDIHGVNHLGGNKLWGRGY